MDRNAFTESLAKEGFPDAVAGEFADVAGDMADQKAERKVGQP